MNPWLIKRTIDMQKWQRSMEYLGVLAYSGNEKGHRIELTMRSGEANLPLDGYTVRGYFYLGKPENPEAVMPVKGSASGNLATLDFPAEAYAVGQASIVVCAEKTGEQIPLYSGSYTVRNGSAKVILDPSKTIPSLSTLLNEIEDMRSVTADGRSQQEQVAQAESSRVSAEQTRITAEQSRVTAEQERASSESSRASAEQARVTAEQNRAAAEQGRITTETSRASAEQSRVNAEQERVTAESSRVSAETERMAAETARAEAEAQRTQMFAGYQGEIDGVKDDLDDLEDLVTVKSPNIFDTSKLVNKSFTDTGVPIANKNTVALLNIPIESGTSIVCNGFARRTDIWNGYVYNKSDELIDRFGLTNFDSTYSGDASWGHYGNIYTAVENAKYFSIYALKGDYELGSNYQLEYGTTISEYMPFGSSVFRYEDEIVSVKNKQDKLTAGRGISIEDNVITCTVDGGGDSDIVYSYESKLLNDSYTTLAEIVNPKEILFAENNVINEKARFLFGSHKLCAENNYFVISQDKSFSSTAKGGSLEIAFEYDGNAFEIGCRGLADFRFKVNEGNGWKYLDEKPMNVSTQNGYRTLTQIRFLYAKHRKIIIETSSTVWCLRYDVRYQVSPLTLDRPIALFIGSSITEGSASGEFPMASYGAVCSNEMGWEFINLGVGGRGIITPFDSRPSVLDAVSDITQFTDAEYIFIGGSINDSSNNASELTSGLEAIIDTVRESLPDATIVVLGTWSPQPDSNNSVHVITNNAVKSGALTKGCAFIDSMNAQVYDASGNIVQNGTTWVTGTFAHASGDNDMSTIGNCERVYTHENGSIDHTHPGRVGHYYIGMRLASACRSLKLK